MRFGKTTRRSLNPANMDIGLGEPLTPHGPGVVEEFRDSNGRPLDVRALSIKHRMSLGVLMEDDGFVTLEQPRVPRPSDALKEIIPGQIANWPGRASTSNGILDRSFDIVVEEASGQPFTPTRSANPSWTGPSLPSGMLKSAQAEGRVDSSMGEREPSSSGAIFAAPRSSMRSKRLARKNRTASTFTMGELNDYKSGPKTTAGLAKPDSIISPRAIERDGLAIRQPSSPTLSIFRQPARQEKRVNMTLV